MHFASLANFEIRYQFKNPVFWVSFAIFFLFGFGMSASDNVSIGTPGAVHENSPYAVTTILGMMTLFYLFAITTFVANAVVRDDTTGFGQIIRSTPIDKTNLLAGRFIGSLIIAILGYTALPIGIAIGAMMPWVDPETVGPGGFANYAWPFLIIALPNLILSSALLFSLATITRSMLASYIGVLVLVIGYLATISLLSSQTELRETVAKFEPLGIAAVGLTTRYWTSAEMNSMLIPFEGNLLINRLITLGWAALLCGFAWARFSMTERAPTPWKLERLAKKAAREEKTEAVQAGGLSALPNQSYGKSYLLKNFFERLKLEAMLVLKSPGLIVLMLLAFGLTVSNLIFAQTSYGTPSYPLTANIVDAVAQNMTLSCLIVAVFYGGELVWRERDVKINEIIDAAPLPGWVVFVPKILAVFAVLLAMALVGMMTGVLYQLAHGAENIDLSLYFVSYILPRSFDLIQVAVLSVFFQVLSPNKYIGWGLMLVWFVFSIFLDNLGYTNILYTYGAGPDEPLSDMNGTGGFWVGGLLARAYWGAFGVLLLVFAHWAWPRGTVVAVLPRLKAVRQRLTMSSGVTAVAAIITMIGTGVIIHHNTMVLNTYYSGDESEINSAEYERKYLKYETLPRPVITDVNLDVAIYPDERRMITKGYYDLRNDSGKPIGELHVRQGDTTVAFTNLALQGAKLESHDKKLGYRIYRFQKPLQPGASTRLEFTSDTWRRGFANDTPSIDVVDNGTFVNNSVFAPIIGMDRSGLLGDRTARRRQGLPDELRVPRLEDTAAQKENYARFDWVNSHITISTSADQVPIAPGNKLSDKIKNGRRTAVFKSPAPILNFISLQSARYAVAEDHLDGVQLAVYHDPKHKWNVPAMLKAMKTSLGYYRNNFGPYQFNYARIIEFPGYQSFAQAFAGTMPYSENIGFAADVRDPEKIDYVTYVTAHEVAHQYWAHQVIGANMQGSTLLSETLAQYSALMVMQELYGRDKIRRFLKYELDTYLNSRKADVLPEQPIMRVEDQQHIYYNKGSLVMYLLQERLGEDAVNRALSRFVNRYRFKAAPYPRSLDLIAELRKEAKTKEQQNLITDLYEKITIYDLKVKEVEVSRSKDGRWASRITVEAAKFYSDGAGNESTAPLAEAIEIGLFTERPGEGAFSKANVLSLKRWPIRGGKTVINVVTDKRPEYVGVDPYNFYIDRNSDDNVLGV